MRARIYLEDNFFKAFNNYQPGGLLQDVDQTTENKNQLVNILKHSEFHLPITEREVIKIHKKLAQNYEATDPREFFLFMALRKHKLFNNPIDNNKPYSLFLLDKIDADINIFNESNNLISIGVNYNFENSISPKSFASKLVDRQMNGIEVIKHRCKNILILDPYLFIDQPNMQPKIPNVIKLLNELYLNNSNTSCHLSIVTDNPNNNNLITAKIQSIHDGLNNPNLTISVYSHSSGKFRNNRHIITDYSITDCQHVFDRDDDSISCDFLYDGEINSSFTRVNDLLKKIRISYNNDPVSIGVITMKFGNLLDNGLFEEL